METGHAVNYTNLLKMKSFVIGYDTKYQPKNPKLLLASITAKCAEAENSLKLVNTAAAPWVSNVNIRGSALAPVNKLLTRVFNATAASEVSDLLIADVRSFINNIKGVRATPVIPVATGENPAPNDQVINQISASQTGIEHTIDNLGELIELLLLEPNYDPNEPEIQTATLQTLLTEIIAKNQTVIDVFPALDNARISRNETLYGDNGVNQLASLIKKYVRSVYGGNSPQYHQVAGLKFTKPKS